MHNRDHHPEKSLFVFNCDTSATDLEIHNKSARVKICHATFSDHLSLDLLYREKGWEHAMGSL